jgi:hypothetical protein
VLFPAAALSDGLTLMALAAPKPARKARRSSSPIIGKTAPAVAAVRRMLASARRSGPVYVEMLLLARGYDKAFWCGHVDMLRRTE